MNIDTHRIVCPACGSGNVRYSGSGVCMDCGSPIAFAIQSADQQLADLRRMVQAMLDECAVKLFQGGSDYTWKVDGLSTTIPDLMRYMRDG
jgi:hypothetical protein